MVTAIAIAKSAETPTARDFIAKAKAMPYLTLAEETAAARRLEEHGDSDARNLLVNSHLRQVVKMAMVWAKYGFSAEDLIQEGNMGLMTAVQKFDVSKGHRLTTYATWWIKAFMADYMMKNRSSIRIPNTAKNKKVLMLLSKAKTALASGNGNVAAIYKKIAKACECDIDTVRIIHTLSTGTKSFSDPTGQEEGTGEFGDFIPDTAPLPEEVVADWDERSARHNILQRAVSTLNEREAAIFKWRRMVDEDDIKTLETLSGEFGVSRERIRQIEVGAFEKVQAFIHKEELARRGEELARIAAERTRVSKAATDKPKMILAAVTEPKKIAAPKKTPGWNVVTRNGERQLVFCP
ncbi:sigma-70 family RNA polymerase sigma factor [Rhizobium sp. MHM7A]|uniref:sigma-70 family RNA polymerase sigma factor n=1 Tax=Rhizobium sp. MHM7A TaxID=2583233 RepID=UPI0011066360|nr:sigma-70 family RNA polymerase sigma factor [Rhizobium sp. MHM7A]TLX16722.1 sigma-70 family RNA polymerase sigma factor [Rhizobium sp. MHM7A]